MNRVDIDDVPVGMILKKYRKRANLTHHRIAAELSIPNGKMTKLEQGISNVPTSFLKRWCHALGIHKDEVTYLIYHNNRARIRALLQDNLTANPLSIRIASTILQHSAATEHLLSEIGPRILASILHQIPKMPRSLEVLRDNLHKEINSGT